MQLYFNSTHIDILPTDESYRYRSIMGEHTLTLYFSLPTYTDIPTGAWCEFANERYTLNQPAKVVKHNTRHFEYTLTMDSEGVNLKNYKFRNPNDKTLKFPFTASPRYHIQILVDCLNMIDSGWQVGTTIEANEKLVSYNHNNCLEALEMIAKAFETEYEIIGKTIHLHKVEYFKNNPLPLQYGKGKGFKTGVSRTTEQSRITRLYVQGGERNIDRSKYGNKELLLPKSQEYIYEGVTFLSDDKGLSIAIKNAQNNGFINEQSLDLSHIYPKRKGTITEVFEVDKNKHFYDFTDTSIPETLNFSDLQIKGEKMLIYFESGMLSGREFEVSKYDHAQKRFQLVPKEEDGTTMPNDIFKPAIGDEYSVYNMQMPNAYISDNATKSGASWEMMKEACKYLYENRADLFTFTGDLDGIWAKKNWVNVGGRLKMGAYIHFSDNEFQRTPVAIRIVGLKEYVNNPYSPQIELSNKVQGHSFISEMRKLQNQEVYFGEMNKKAISETKRSWRNALETIKQVEEAFPEYTKSIVPATVQTMMALIGNKSTQFDFVVSKTNPIKTPHTLYFDKNTKQINAGSGWLKHFTLGSSDITPNRDANSYKYWNIPAFVSGRLDDKTKTYYLYIKASKNDEIGEFILSENKIDIEQEAGFYHFLYATVNSEYEGERGIAKHNGFTEITGGQIKTDKITSGNGEQYIHLFDDHIEIKANLKITDGNKTEIKQLVSPDLLSLESRLKSSISNIQVGGRNLLKNSGKRITNNNYNIAIYELTENINEGEAVTLTIKGKLGTGKTVFAAYNSGDFLELSQLYNKGNGIHQNTFNWRKIWNDGRTADNKTLWIWTYDGSVSTESTIEWIKLEKGNRFTEWTPAPGDLESQITTAKTATEAYARAQAELTKTQAIANADGKITSAEQRQIQQLQQKLQEAKTFAEQKVNELNIGGRNLLRGSSGLILSNQPYYLQSNYAGNGGYTNETFMGNRVLRLIYNWQGFQSRTDFEDRPIIISFWAKTNKQGVKFVGITDLDIEIVNGNNLISDGKWHRYVIKKNGRITTYNGSNQGFVEFYKDSGHIEEVYVSSFKIEYGNTPTDWTPAPEDIENKVADIQTDLTTAINNAKAQIEAEKRNIENSNTRIQKLENKTQIFSDTQIDGNVVATGTMIVGNTQGTKAGITGVGDGNDSIRFWAGEPDKKLPVETPQQAEQRRRQSAFLVLQDGTLHATNAHISGQVNATSGNIGYFYINDEENHKRGRIYAGSRKTSEITIGNIGIEIESDSPLSKISASFGNFNSMVFSNTYAAEKIDYTGNSSNRIGSYIKIRPQGVFNDTSLAQFIDGNIFNIGKRAIYDDGYIGVADVNTIVDNIKYTHMFIFTGVTTDFRTVNLPNAQKIIQITGKSNVTFELVIVMSIHVDGKRIRVQGVNGGALLDNNGNWHAGNNFGYMDMEKGDILKLRYYNSHYYITGHDY